MSLRKIAAVVLLCHCAWLADAQSLYATVDPGGKTVDIKGMTVGQRVFLTMQVLRAKGYQPLSVLVDPDGSQHILDLGTQADLPIVAGVSRGDSTCFYYLERVDKNLIALSTLLLDRESGKGTRLDGLISIPGVIYGSYIEGDDLFMLCAVKNEFKLRLLQIRNGKLKSSREFPLTFNLGKRKNQRVTFINMANQIAPLQAAGSVKICKDRGVIWILIDEPHEDNDVTMTASTLYRTTIIRLQLNTGEVTVKSLYESAKVRFTSAILGNEIYRLLLGSSRIDQFDFGTGKKINSFTVPSGRENKSDSTYVRIGSKSRTLKSTKGNSHMDRYIGSYLIVDSLRNGERVFTLGDYGDSHSVIAAYGGSVPIIASLIITASSLIIGELAEGPITTVYYYCKAAANNTLQPSYDVPLLRTKVDAFDYQQFKNQLKYDFRGYINTPETTFEISQKNRSNVIEIHKFTAAGTATSAQSPN